MRCQRERAETTHKSGKGTLSSLGASGLNSFFFFPVKEFKIMFLLRIHFTVTFARHLKTF